MTPRPARLQSASRTDRGVRDANEDAVLSALLPDGRWLAAVADGMGGLQGGEMASRTALDVLRHRLEAGSSLVPAVEDANRAVFDRGDGDRSGTTLVVALFETGGLRIANVGDSRAYLLGPMGLVQVTRDHTFGAEAAAHGDATAREVALSRWGATLTRFLGSSGTVEVDEFGPLTLEDVEQVLLCSDGVHGVLNEAEIRSCLEGRLDPDGAVDRLLSLSLERGGNDNLSAVVVRTPPVRVSRTAGGTVRSGSGVSKPQEPHPAGPRELHLEPPDPEPEGIRLDLWPPSEAAPEDPGVLLSASLDDGAAAPPDAHRWDPAGMASRSLRTRRRKPGRLRGVLLVLVLLGAVVLMMTLLP